MGLIVQPRPADMGRRRMLEEFFFDRVPVEPGDGAQPPGIRGAGPALGLPLAGEGLDVRAADREQVQGTGAAPGGELAQVQRVRFAGQPAVPGQEPGQGEPFGIAECRWMGTRAVVVAVIGYLPVRAETEGDRASRSPSNDKVTTVKPPCPSRHVTTCSRAEPNSAPGSIRDRRFRAGGDGAERKASGAQIVLFGAPRCISALMAPVRRLLRSSSHSRDSAMLCSGPWARLPARRFPR